MRNNNLAYNADYSYGKLVDPREIKQITNIRTTGGIMIKADKRKHANQGTEKNKNHRPKNKIGRSTLISVSVICVMAFFVLFRGLMITSGYEKLEEKNTLLSKTITENQKIQFKIDQTLDLKNIETVAKNTFNMGQPSKNQTVYINLDQSDEVKKTRGGNTVTDAVKNFFGGIVEYFR